MAWQYWLCGFIVQGILGSKGIRVGTYMALLNWCSKEDPSLPVSGYIGTIMAVMWRIHVYPNMWPIVTPVYGQRRPRFLAKRAKFGQRRGRERGLIEDAQILGPVLSQDSGPRVFKNF